MISPYTTFDNSSPRLNLDVYPYLPRARVAMTSAKSYMSLLSGLGA